VIVRWVRNVSEAAICSFGGLPLAGLLRDTDENPAFRRSIIAGVFRSSPTRSNTSGNSSSSSYSSLTAGFSFALAFPFAFDIGSSLGEDPAISLLFRFLPLEGGGSALEAASSFQSGIGLPYI